MKVLCENDATVISRCTDCDGMFIWHQNLMLTFRAIDFRDFKSIVHSLPFDGHSYPFPDGERRMVLRTPNHDIAFCFRQQEFENFCALVSEAVYLMDVYEIINEN